jgi:Molecular chaperone GrpE (heat shock protein)
MSQKHSKKEKQKKSVVTEENIENTTENPTPEIQQESEAEQIEKLTQEVEELKDQKLRLIAEFDNLRKRNLKERSELIKTAGEKVLSEMLPLVDDFERAQKAMETAQDIDAVKEGITLIYNKFVSFLLANGVKEIPTENEIFDTDLHEAVTIFPAPTEDLKGKIIDCISKGYTLNDKVIRYPKVVVGE